MSIKEGFKNSKIAGFWLKYEHKIVLVLGIVLIAAISFEGGYLHGQKNIQGPIVINKVASTDISKCENQATESASVKHNFSTSQTTEPASSAGKQPENQTCPFVASKNSNKYHLASCQWAQKIKAENKICFSSADEAQKRGYIGAKCCIK